MAVVLPIHRWNAPVLQNLSQSKYFAFLKSPLTDLLPDKKLQKIICSEFQIPVPPIEEQRRIVSILDKFDMLATSISEGLPKEIELRRKQYEYYRNQLLSFPDNKATD